MSKTMTSYDANNILTTCCPKKKQLPKSVFITNLMLNNYIQKLFYSNIGKISYYVEYVPA